MPVSDRKFYLSLLKDEIEKQNEEIEKQKGNMTAEQMIKNKPFVPDYVTKTSAKK